MTSNMFLQLPAAANHHITYQQIHRKASSNKPYQPGIVFLGGFMSDMTGAKASALAEFAAQKNYSFTRFDYFGHGQSSGRFEEGTIGLWKDNVLAVLDQLTTGKQILVGSSMGGWLMLLAALERPERIAALVGIASAPDFTEYLIWDKFSPAEQAHLQQTGRIELPADYCSGSYPISWSLISEARNHLLLHKPIPIMCPVHLIHGMQDKDVPFDTSLTLARQLAGSDVTLTLVKNGDHRMSEADNLRLLCETVEKAVEQE